MGQRESDDRFRLLVESVVDYAIFVLDLEGRVSSWNAGAQRMKGYLANEIIGRHFSIFYPDADAATKCQMELEVATREGRFEEEGWRVRKDGTKFWANVVITAVRNSEGSLVAFGKVTRDLTDRRRAEDELRASEERMRLLIASVTDYAIFSLDPTGHVTSWNPGAERLKGYAASEIIGSHFSRFYPEADVRAGKCEVELEGALRHGRYEDEGWRVRKDGTTFWANVVITPIHGAVSAFVGFAKVTRDLTERKRHEEERIRFARAEEARFVAEAHKDKAEVLVEQLRQARDRAEEATRIKDEFLATISHELRTPLTAILGWGRLLQGDRMTPEKTARAIETIVRNATAQNQLIDDLLDVSRIIAGQLRLDLEFVDINQVVTAAIDVVRPAAEAKGIALQWSLNPTAGVIKGDPGRLQQVLWNLLTNAVKFTPRGGRVQVTLRADESEVEVDVADTGRGIVRDYLPRIFDRFSQEEGSNARKAGGLGLGLAIVKHLVELHGGTVEAQSEGENAGAVFRVKLPLTVVAASPPALAADTFNLDDVSYPSELEGLHVLVLDDEADAREVVKEVLERGGAVVSLATTAAEALAAIRREKPDLVISDIGMPEEDGYFFIRKLREMPREEGGRIPAVALTAYARAEDRRKALLSGFQNHATKPIEPQELVMVVSYLVGHFA